MAAEAGADSILFERLAQALAPQYTLKREIARGGMGVVYLAHDNSLDRPVAVKLLLPEHASAALAARFVREAQVLSRLRHPNIVTVHHVPQEPAGLFFYVMEWLDGETLQDRLTRGALPQRDVVRIGAELLDALGTAHKRGWIHRDVKPGNIFLTEDRAILTDFGIARPVSEDATSLTETRQMIGTLAYMSPEQRDGRPVTEASDIYSAGLVIYEMMSGRRWWQRDSEEHDWSGVPSRLRTVLRKAMQPEPGDRYRDAKGFRKDLVNSSRTSTRVVVGALSLLALALLLWSLWPGPPRASGRIVRLQILESRGAGGWRDSVGAAVTTRLASFPDLIVTGPFGSHAKELKGPGLVLTGSVEFRDDTLQATIQARRFAGRQIRVTRKESVANWRILADSLASQLIYGIYLNDTEEDPSLPKGALPRTPEGLRAWTLAEPLFTQARWGEALIAYRVAEALDSTCLICTYRLNDIERWLDLPHDSARMARLQAHIEDFPSHYRLLIQADATEWPERLTLMDSATRTRDFFPAFFRRGDELFHRGPLFYHHRREAESDFERVIQMRPDFAPAWEHLAWLRIAEGESLGAAHALDSLQLATKEVDQTALGVRFLLKAAFAYRFGPSGSGDDTLKAALQLPAITTFPFLAMGPRLMLTFDAPNAAIGMGRIFARRDAVVEIRSGLLAQVFGHLARGAPDSALFYARRLNARVPSIEAELFAAELAGTLALVDSDATPGQEQRAVDAMKELRRFTLSAAASDEARRRAAWLVVLLAGRTGVGNDVAQAHQALGRDSSAETRRYLSLIQADQLARRRMFDRALVLTTWNGEDLGRQADPFFSTVTRFLRATWLAQQENLRDAVLTLLWHEAYDFGTYPIGNPQPSEVDQAFGTLARWKQARILEGSAESVPQACRAYGEVVRLWQEGEPPYQARARLAAERLSSLSCGDR